LLGKLPSGLLQKQEFDGDDLMHLYPMFKDWDEVVKYKKQIFSKLVLPRHNTIYQPHMGQNKLHFEPWQYHIADWGRRGGKTQGAAAETTFEASLENRQIWVAAPTYILTDKVFRLVYHWIVNEEVFGPGSVMRALYNPRGERMIHLSWGTVIEGKTCENPKSLLGEGNHLVVLDEAAQLPTKDIWETYIEPTLTDYMGRFLAISTPRGYNWFWKLYEEGMSPDGQRDGWRSSHMKSSDNPFLNSEWIEKKRRRTDPATFRQEYEASFEVKKGLVYPDFRAIDIGEGGHLYDPAEHDINEYWSHYRAIDPGLSNPTACLWISVDESNNVWVHTEYEVSEGLIKEHADNITAATRYPTLTTYIDPSAARRNDQTGMSTQDVYRDYGIYPIPAENNLAFGIQKVSEYLRATLDRSSVHPKIFISKNCRLLIGYLLQYEWAETVSTTVARNDPDKPRKYHDHLPDALRYLLASSPRFLPLTMRRNMDEHEDEEVEEVVTYGSPSTGL
jgi:hypothetical protein